MKVIRGRDPDAVTEKRSGTFTGDVWGTPVLPPTCGVMINHVHFAPGARTHWHTHETGQVLVVTAGEGRACTDGGEPHVIAVGDVVWIPAGERHWHGAAPDTFMSHLAISIGGHDWQEPVADEDHGP